MPKKTPSNTELMLNPDGSIYHLKLLPGELADTIILVGDPWRVSTVSSCFDSIVLKKHEREFVTHTGFIGDRQISVVSTGMGACNIEIALNEFDALFNIDLTTRTVKKNLTALNIIRLGTCGALDPSIPPGSLIVSSHAIGFDCLFEYYNYVLDKKQQRLLEETQRCFKPLPVVNSAYVGSADNAWIERFKKISHIGITLTCTGFYAPQHRSLRLPIVHENMIDCAKQFEFEQQTILNLEMETAAIYRFCDMLGHHACSMSAVVGNRVTETVTQDSKAAIKNMIEKALAVITAS